MSQASVCTSYHGSLRISTRKNEMQSSPQNKKTPQQGPSDSWQAYVTPGEFAICNRTWTKTSLSESFQGLWTHEVVAMEPQPCIFVSKEKQNGFCPYVSFKQNPPTRISKGHLCSCGPTCGQGAHCRAVSLARPSLDPLLILKAQTPAS